MSHETPNGPQVTTHASRGGSGWKWLTGAAVAAVLAGGGYYAWKNTTPVTPQTDLAYNQSSSTDSFRAGPLASGQNSVTEPTASTESATPTAPTETQTASVTTSHRHQTVRTAAAPVPEEETVGVIPASATVPDDSESVIVQGARRPIWAHAPSAYRLSATYPESSLERGREGEASVHCTVLQNGALDCVKMSETNPDFGLAALRVAHLFRHAPTRADGSSAIGAPVNLHVVFRMSDDDRRG